MTSDAIEGSSGPPVSTPGVGPTGESPQGLAEPFIELSVQIRRQVEDALRMLEHAVDTGFKRADGGTIEEGVVVVIKTTAAMLGISAIDHDANDQRQVDIGGTGLKASQWVAFELAYHRLAALMSPITAETLRNTQAVGAWRYTKMSPAQSFTRWLWVVAIGYAAFVVGGEWGMQYHGPVMDGEAGPQNTAMQLVQILVPYAYGGLGSCVYLLRSAHKYIYERTFDVRRKPEYLNRVLLGTISGGAITLFVERITTDNGVGINLSSAALGFLAGYSTDFLFSTIERIIGAILPKVGVDTVRRNKAGAGATPGVDTSGETLKDLLDRFDSAKNDDERRLYSSLIEKVRERL